MKSNYKQLGDFIRPVNIRNTNLDVEILWGVSIKKILMPSIANTVGTNMKTYKIIKKNQFAYGPVTSRNGDKISIALLEDYDEVIISQAYTVFEVIDENELSPEYLMMWFRRPEFDRYARFKSHGSARETFDWDELCEVELPIPSIEKQRAIVAEYNTVVNRIKLNEQLNKKLEATAQALYKHWFVDFEFPSEALAKDGVPQPYKSSGGKMVFNAELDKEIPEGWGIATIEELCNCNIENLPRDHQYSELLYLDTGNLTNNKIDEIQLLKLGKDIIPSRAKRVVKHNDIIYSTVRPNLRHFGIIKNPQSNLVVSTGFAVLSKKDSEIPIELIYQLLTTNEVIEDLHSRAEMSVSTYPGIKPEDLLEIKLAMPDTMNIKLNIGLLLLSKAYDFIYRSNNEARPLLELKDLLLSKMTKVEVDREVEV